MNVLRALAAVGAATAIGACGSQPSYREQVADACAEARAHAGTTPRASAAASGKALQAIRDLDPPEDAAADARALVGGLEHQQRALDGLARAVGDRAAPAELRERVGAVGTQGDLLAPVARKVGVPACGTAATRMVDRLQAEDYAATARRFMALLEHDLAALPQLALHDPGRMKSQADDAWQTLGDDRERFDGLDVPKGLDRAHRALVDDLFDLSDPYFAIWDRMARGKPAHVRRELAAFRRTRAEVRAHWRALEAKLPRPAADSVWGGQSAEALASAERKARYLEKARSELARYRLSLELLDGGPVRGPKAIRIYKEAARTFERARAELAGAQPPTEVAAAHRLMVTGLRQARDFLRAAVRFSTAPTPALALRIKRLADNGFTGEATLLRAERAFRTKGYKFELGVDSEKRPRRGGHATNARLS